MMMMMMMILDFFFYNSKTLFRVSAIAMTSTGCRVDRNRKRRRKWKLVLWTTTSSSWSPTLPVSKAAIRRCPASATWNRLLNEVGGLRVSLWIAKDVVFHQR